MDKWFAKDSTQYFEIFSSSHFTMLILYFVGVLFLLTILKYKDKFSPLLPYIQWTLFSFLLMSETSYQTWSIVNGLWNPSGYLPLHLCGIASLIAMVALATKNTHLSYICFFFGLVPAFMALVTPELPYDYHHYRFSKFFIHHMAISWSSLFVMIIHGKKLHVQALVGSYGLLVLYALVTGYFLNPLLDANYLFLANKPTANTPLDLLGTGFWYYIKLGAITLFVFILQFCGWNYVIGRKG
ncbi:YwaF family protein [Aquibacillus kalidii]|uniref:YwaF family protein n=1 Tax=Aquibacillus kalidii TaxID=2762597 RepID=UPI001646167C|nr:TIGR02206 family membrane protein [Aquibacillus kalidii]